MSMYGKFDQLADVRQREEKRRKEAADRETIAALNRKINELAARVERLEMKGSDEYE